MLWSGGRTVIIAFLIITAWNLCEKEFRVERIVRTWLTTFTYSLLVGAVFAVCNGNRSFLFRQCFPIVNNVVWFVSVYLLLLATQPILNYVLANAPKKILGCTLGMLLLVESAIPTIYPNSSLRIGYYATFCLIYLCAGYVKKYADIKRIKKRYLVIGFCGGYIVPPLFFYLLYKYELYVPEWITGMGFSNGIFFSNISSIPCLIAAFSAFLLIQSLHIKSKGTVVRKAVGLASGCSLDVYVLLSMNGPGQRLWWVEFFHVPNLGQNGMALIKIYAICFTAYFLAVAIGKIRISVLDFVFCRHFCKRCFNIVNHKVNDIRG